MCWMKGRALWRRLSRRLQVSFLSFVFCYMHCDRCFRVICSLTTRSSSAPIPTMVSVLAVINWGFFPSALVPFFVLVELVVDILQAFFSGFFE